jgi:hypothetical protein
MRASSINERVGFPQPAYNPARRANSSKPSAFLYFYPQSPRTADASGDRHLACMTIVTKFLVRQIASTDRPHQLNGLPGERSRLRQNWRVRPAINSLHRISRQVARFALNLQYFGNSNLNRRSAILRSPCPWFRTRAVRSGSCAVFVWDEARKNVHENRPLRNSE